MLKMLFASVLVLSVQIASAQQLPSLGRKVSPKLNESGNPKLNLNSTSRTFSMIVTFDNSVIFGSPAGATAPAFWTLVNKDTMTAIIGWKSTYVPQSPGPGGTSVLTMDLNQQPDVGLSLQSLRRAALVISLGQASPAPSVYVDLAELCVSHPNRFMNLDNGQQGCQ